jgi:hypothetical protein
VDQEKDDRHDDPEDGQRDEDAANGFGESFQLQVASSRFEVRGSRFEVRGSRFEVRGSRFEEFDGPTSR